MLKTIFCLFALSSTCVFAAKVGDTYDQVLSEKGHPLSKAEKQGMKVLNYADETIKIADDKVVSITTKTGASQSADSDKSQASATWVTDYQTALKTAQKDHKNLFLFFTGSDWCVWCNRLNKEILSTPEFQSYAAQNLVLVELDFPRGKKQSDDLKKQNQELAKKYRIEGFPTVIVLDAKGKTVGQLGYQQGGPKPFIKALKNLD